MDYVPLVLTLAGPLLIVCSPLIPYRESINPVSVLIAGIVLLLAVYPVAWLFPGSPDVWDFYRTTWWVPPVLGVAACVSTALLGRQKTSLRVKQR